MVDFPIGKRHFRVRRWSGAFSEPLERKKEKTKCSYSRPYRAKKKCKHFLFSRKKEHLVERNQVAKASLKSVDTGFNVALRVQCRAM